jgi:hypothetical protein
MRSLGSCKPSQNQVPYSPAVEPSSQTGFSWQRTSKLVFHDIDSIIEGPSAHLLPLDQFESTWKIYTIKALSRFSITLTHTSNSLYGRTLYATDGVEECEEYQMFCSLSGHVGWMRWYGISARSRVSMSDERYTGRVRGIYLRSRSRLEERKF